MQGLQVAYNMTFVKNIERKQFWFIIQVLF